LLAIVVLAGIGLSALNSGLNSGQTDGEIEPGVAAEDEPAKPPPDIPAEGEELPPAVFVPGPGTVRAVEEIEEQLEADPENPQLRAELAAAYVRDGRADEARRLVRDTVREIRLPIGYIVVAERLLETGNLDLAETVLEEGLTRFNNNPELQQLLMMTYIMNRRPAPQIEELIERLLQRQHETTPVIVHMGEAYLSLQRGDVEEAIHILNDGLAIENNPYRSQLLYLQGLLFLETGARDEALGTFEEAFRHDPPPWLVGRLDVHINELNSR
jgi:tetratricopeptide (TPR) repeat protein